MRKNPEIIAAITELEAAIDAYNAALDRCKEVGVDIYIVNRKGTAGTNEKHLILKRAYVSQRLDYINKEWA